MVGSHSCAGCGGHSLAQQTSCSPMFAFQAVCVFARCNKAAELCSCSVPEHGESTTGTGSMEGSCPVLSQPGAVPPAHHSVLGQCCWGQQPCCWALLSALCSRWSWLMVTAEERREKMSALVCCRAWPCCGTQHTQESQTAPCTLLCQAVLMVWGTLITRILQGAPPCLTCGILVADAPAEPSSLSWCVAKRGCGGSRQVHGQVYSPWLSVNQIRRDQEQQTPVGGDVLYLLEPRLGSLARQP